MKKFFPVHCPTYEMQRVTKIHSVVKEFHVSRTEQCPRCGAKIGLLSLFDSVFPGTGHYTPIREGNSLSQLV